MLGKKNNIVLVLPSRLLGTLKKTKNKFTYIMEMEHIGYEVLCVALFGFKMS